MAESSHSKPSFSKGRRWAGWINVSLSIFAMLALLVMLNYLAGGYYRRWPVAANSRFQLSSKTIKILQSLTNDVNVTIFFDPHDPQNEELYDLTDGLLKEYRTISPRIKIKLLDFTRFVPEATQFLAKYKLEGLKDKNFVHFESNGHSTKPVYANELSDYDIEAVLSGEAKDFRRTSFRGEMLFSSSIFAVSYPRNIKVYFLTGHGEFDPEDAKSEFGLGKFASVLKDENSIEWAKLALHSTNDIPADCQLLVIASPSKARFADNEITAINDYLAKGQRLLVLMNSVGESGIEKILSRWGIDVGNNLLTDKENTATGQDLLTSQINPTHDVTKAMFKDGLRLQMVLPRSVEKSTNTLKTADIQILAATGTNAVARYPEEHGGKVSYRAEQGLYGLAVAVEQGTIKGASAGTRILVVGDSYCLDNQMLDSAANHYFADFAVNWLIARPSIMLEGLGARPVTSFKLNMTASELKKIRWLFIAGIPGGVLFLGGLVWLRRRK